MSQSRPSIGAILVVAVFLTSTCFAVISSSTENTYSPKTVGETEVLSLVLKSEVEANKWTKKDMICFSVEGMDPSPKFIKMLRGRDLKVRSSAEWRKKFNCGFEVLLGFVTFDESKSARVHAQVQDLREINEGVGHIAILQREGDYLVQKIDGKWRISEYVLSK
jgi:hypothetical protein